MKRNNESHSISNISRSGDTVFATVGCERVELSMSEIAALANAPLTGRGFYKIRRLLSTGKIDSVLSGPFPHIYGWPNGTDTRLGPNKDGNDWLSLEEDISGRVSKYGAIANQCVFGWEFHITKPSKETT